MSAPPLPRPDILQLAAELPMVIDVRGRIWQMLAVPRPGCWFEIDGHRYGLVATETLRSVEERYFTVNRRVLDAFREHALRLVAPDLPPLEADSRRRRQVVRLVRDIIIPRLAELDLAAPPPPPSRAPERVPLARPREGAIRRRRPPGTGFLRPLEGRLVFFERVFDLGAAGDAAGEATGEATVTLRRRRYAPTSESIGLMEAERRVMRRLRHLLKVQALRQLPQRAREARRREREAWGRLSSVEDGRVYENRVGGVLVRDSRVFVFLVVPPFAVEDLDKRLYAFPATRVGLPIDSVDPREILRSGRVMTLDPSFRHPFLSNSGNLCMVTDAKYWSELQRQDLCSGVLQLLHDAKATINAGFAVDSQPYQALETFVSNRVDRAEIEREGLPLFRVGIS